MFLYIALLVIVIMNCMIQRKYNSKSLNAIVFLILCYFCAFRANDVGSDTKNYIQIYDNWTSIEYYKPEYCFYIICSIFKSADAPPYFTQIFITGLTYFLFIKLFNTWSVNPSVSILIFLISFFCYYFESFNITRQLIATAFLMWAWYYFQNKKYYKGILTYVIAIGFHATSLLYLPVLLLAMFINISFLGMILLLTLSLMFAFVFSSVSILGNIIQQFGFILSLGSGDYSTYANYNLGLSKTTFGLITLVIPPVFICYASFPYLKDMLFYKLFFWGVVILNFLSIMPTSYRMVYGVIALEMIIYPVILKKSSYNIRLLALLLLLVEIIFYINDESFLRSSSLIPYNSI